MLIENPLINHRYDGFRSTLRIGNIVIIKSAFTVEIDHGFDQSLEHHRGIIDFFLLRDDVFFGEFFVSGFSTRLCTAAR